MKSHVLSIAALLAATAGVGIALAQAPAAPGAPTAAPAAPAAAAPAAQPPRPTTIEGLQAAAKVAAGLDWPGTFLRLCIAPAPAAAPVTTAAVPVPATPPAAAAAPATPAPTPPPPARATWYAEPAKIGDNLYFLGTLAHNSFALVASNGDMILIDNLYEYAAPDEIIGGLRKLGLDPNKVKYNIIAHAHGDHDGGAKFIQDSIPGIKMIYGAGDWTAVDARTNPAQKVRRDPDSDGTDGRVVTVGDVSVRIITMPGHTPGTLSFLFEFKDGGQVKKVAYVGGTAISFTNMDPAYYDGYIASSQKVAKAAADFGATIVMSNHTEFDNAYFKSHAAANRKTPGERNPWEVGATRVNNYFEVVRLCTQAAKLRATGRL
jgi:metallo-beta-lactamase class B